MRTLLFGAEASRLRPELEKHAVFELVDEQPDTVVCYGGDGTLLAAELRWPGVPKVPIRNSRRGHRCIPHSPEAVIARLAEGSLVRAEYMKLDCAVRHGDDEPFCSLSAMNEVNVHMGRINSAVRFTFWTDDKPYDGGTEIIGDGFVISTPFGSTAYFNQITRGVFYQGIGLALKSTTHYTSHVIAPESTVFRVLITRGPAVLAFDSSPEYVHLRRDDELIVRRAPRSATLLLWEPLPYQTDDF
ncbi:MAG: hypothetical protein ACOX5J_03445 [Candidatus Hydrogenedentales bacterium]|jgi:NAD+ kinase